MDNKKKTYKINNIKYTLVKTLSGVLITTILVGSLSGCNIKKKSSSYNGETYTTTRVTTTTTDANDLYNNNGQLTTTSINSGSMTQTTIANNATISQLDNYLLSIINSKVNFNSSQVGFLTKFIKEQRVIYPYSELFGFNQTLEKYKNISGYSALGMNYFNNNTISGEKVYSIVKENNQNANLADNAKMSDYELKKICNIMAEILNDYIKNHKNADLNFLSQKLSELKILNFDGFSNGYYDSTNGRMGFSVNYLNNKSDSFYKSVVEHETYHFIQSNSLEESKKTGIDTRYGFLYKFNNVKVNSMFWLWYYEGAAEYLTANYNNSSYGEVYQSLIRSMDCIKLPTVLFSKNKVDSFENLSLSRDLNDLFLYFDCQTDEEKKEILNMMYSYNIKYNMNSSSDDFFAEYKNNYSDGKQSYQISKELDSSIAQTLTKLFYKNLLLNIENKDIEINEIFSLISLFESELSREFGYSLNQKTLVEFFELYSDIQAEFFEVIALKLNVPVSDVQQAYNSFNKYMDIEIANNILISEDKKIYFENLKQTRKSNRINSINYFSQRYKEKEK